MKKNRLLSGVFFVLFVAFLALSMRYPLLAMGLGDTPLVIVCEIVMLFVFGAVTLKIFGGKEIAAPEKRQLYVLGIFYLLLNLVTIEMQVQVVAVTLSIFSQALATNMALCYLMLVVKFVLLAAGIYFAGANFKEATEASVVFEDGVSPEELNDETIEALNDQMDEAEAAVAVEEAIMQEAAEDTVND